VQWQVALGDYTAGLVRGGDTIWLFDEYWNAAAGCVQQNRILGFSATATSSARLASIPLPSRYSGFPQTLAVASGTLFESTLALVGYRIPAG
jgi:hypothetical protein